MKVVIRNVIVYFTIAFLCYSCKQEEVRPFNLRIVLTSNYPSVERDSILPTVFQNLCNYYQGTCDTVVFVPSVEFVRDDIDSIAYQYEQELSSINNFRRSVGMLSGTNLMEDFDEMHSKWKAPSILYKKGTRSATLSNSNLPIFDTTFVVALKGASIDSISKIRKFIGEYLCSKSSGAKIAFVFTDKSGKMDADQAYQNFLEWKKGSVRSASEIDSCLRNLEISYPNDYRFTLEKLKNMTQNGTQRIQKGNEWLVLQMVEKAISEGKSDELMNILKKWANNPVDPHSPIIVPPKPPREHVQDKKVFVEFNSMSLEEQINFMSNPKYSSETKRQFKSIIIDRFEGPNSMVIIQSIESGKEGAQLTIFEYLDKLRLTNRYKVKILSPNPVPDKGKISQITINEN